MSGGDSPVVDQGVAFLLSSECGTHETYSGLDFHVFQVKLLKPM